MSGRTRRRELRARTRPLARTALLGALGIATAVGLGSGGSPAQAAFPGTNGRLACEGQRGPALPDPAPAGASRSEVFTVNPDGSDERVLTDNQTRDGDPSFSPDGLEIAFESYRDGFSEAYKMAADGTGQTRLTTSGNNEDRSTSWSPDGTKIAFHSTRDELPIGETGSRFELYVMDADGSNQVRLTNNLAQDTFPAWSPDGSRIVFTTNRDLDFEIYSMKPDGTDVQRLTVSTGEDAHPSWSPDGTQIAFHTRRDTGLEIYRMNADGSDPTRVTTAGGFKFFPIWSPDGKRIAFNGDLQEAGNFDVYHVDATDGSDPVRVTTEPGFDGRCDWLAIPLPPVPPPPPVPPMPPIAPPPPPPPPAAKALLPAKMSLARARLIRRDRVLDVLAPITSLASGKAKVELHAAGRRTRFEATVDSTDARIRFRKSIAAAQAQLGTGIVTIDYPGDADTRPQSVRLRAAAQKANLRLGRPTLVAGRLRAQGTISSRARGIVRLQLQYVVDGKTIELPFRGRIEGGRWSIDEQLSAQVQAAIARRTGTVHSYTLFTGYFPERMRGEMRSFQVLGDR